LALAVLTVSVPTLGADRSARGNTTSAQERGDAAAKAFLQGHYEDALAIYLDLYVSTGRPEYLRNIARCQQSLKQYDRAIENFKEYMRRAESMRAAEKNEIQSYINDMQTARAQEQSPPAQPRAGTPPPPAAEPSAAAQSAPAAPPSPAAQASPGAQLPTGWGPAPPPTAAPPGSDAYAQSPAMQPQDSPSRPGAYPAPGGAEQPPGPGVSAPGAVAMAPSAPVLLQKTPSAPPRRRSPLKVAGVVAMIAGGALVAAGSVFLLSSQAAHDQGKDMGCPMPGSTYCRQQADTVSALNTVSLVTYIAGGVAAAGGLTLFLLAPSPSSSGQQHIGIAARFRF
jgi:hypothetical protein